MGAFNNNLLPDSQAYFYVNGTDTQTLVSYGGESKTPAIPAGTVTVGELTFQDQGLTSIEIPSSVTTIVGWAFQSNSLTTLTIPASATLIGDYAFSYNSLTDITFMGAAPTTLGPGVFSNNSIPNGGIKVPSAYLASYHANASNLGVTTAKIVGY
jgi:hypothetical protein